MRWLSEYHLIPGWYLLLPPLIVWVLFVFPWPREKIMKDRIWLCRTNHMVSDARRESCVTAPEQFSEERILKPSHPDCGWYIVEKDDE